MSSPRILIYDIETFPIKAAVWGLFKQNISIDMIEEDWALMSFAGKWLGSKKVHYKDNRHAEHGPRDDRETLRFAYDLLSQADIVVAHNGNKFDMRKLKARFIEAGFPPLPPIKQVDTLLIARGVAAFSSNRLAFLTEKLTSEKKSAHGKFAGYALWKACAANVKAAWNECRAYNKQDVVSLEELYLLLRPWDKLAPNLGVYQDDAVQACPKCGSHHVQRRGEYSTSVGVYQRFHCQDCGAWSRGGSLINTRHKRATLLRNAA